MPTLDYQTAGESHGPGLLVVITGVPSGVYVDAEFINKELARRQGGFGRSGRQGIEEDRVQALSGVRAGRTTGAPVTFLIPNKDSRLEDAARTPPVFRPRPGHADLAGALKFLTTDCRDVLERASARETAARTAAGALARCLLREFDIEVFGCVRAIGGVEGSFEVTDQSWRGLAAARDASQTYCPDAAASERQVAVIREAKQAKDTVGGLVEAHIFGCPPGLGSCMDWRDRLDARLAAAVMGVQAIKGVEIGLGRESAQRPGSGVHDAIRHDASLRDSSPAVGFVRGSNNAGGIEGGMTNGEAVVVRAAMKPISTLLQGMPSVDLNTKSADRSQYERSDICAVPAASVVVENVAAFEVARAFCGKFSGDSLVEVRGQYQSYLKLLRQLPLEEGQRLA